MWGSVPVTTDAILKTNYTSLAKYGSIEKGKVNDDCHAMVRYAITRKLFDVLLYSTRKEERCSGTVWLLSLTMYAGHHPAIQQMLPEIQVCHSFTSQKYLVLFFPLFLIFESYLFALDFC